jgi:hypothetical protein
MDFFQDEKSAREEFLPGFAKDKQMYFWPLNKAFEAAKRIFSINHNNK